MEIENKHHLTDKIQDDPNACSAPFYETGTEKGFFWTGRFQAAENGKENALLFIDAANTKNETGLTPSQLHQENKELKESLGKARFELVEYISNKSRDEKHARENIGNSPAIIAIDLATKKTAATQ